MATPKRFLKTAVKRNRVKRLIRESFRLKQTMLKNKDVVIVVKRSVEDEQRLWSDLNRIWHRVSEIK
jgi:ribonuclease P protein component